MGGRVVFSARSHLASPASLTRPFHAIMLGLFGSSLLWQYRSVTNFSKEHL
jgi:hypothetical protein